MLGSTRQPGDTLTNQDHESCDSLGQEIEYPMAIVILGGLLTSTLLNLFVLPVLYLRFGRGSHSEPVAGPPRRDATAPG
jgi:hypothetical protein